MNHGFIQIPYRAIFDKKRVRFLQSTILTIVLEKKQMITEDSQIDLAYCAKQIQYDMKHGVELNEIMEVFRRIPLNGEYADLRSNGEAAARLQEIEDQLSGAQKIREDRFLWHRNAFK